MSTLMISICVSFALFVCNSLTCESGKSCFILRVTASKHSLQYHISALCTSVAFVIMLCSLEFTWDR